MRGKRKTKTQQAKEGGYLVRSCRLRIDRARLDPELRRELDRAFGVYRHLYNATVERTSAMSPRPPQSTCRPCAPSLPPPRCVPSRQRTGRFASPTTSATSRGTTRCRRSVVRRRSSTISRGQARRLLQQGRRQQQGISHALQSAQEDALRVGAVGALPLRQRRRITGTGGALPPQAGVPTARATQASWTPAGPARQAGDAERRKNVQARGERSSCCATTTSASTTWWWCSTATTPCPGTRRTALAWWRSIPARARSTRTTRATGAPASSVPTESASSATRCASTACSRGSPNRLPATSAAPAVRVSENQGDPDADGIIAGEKEEEEKRDPASSRYLRTERDLENRERWWRACFGYRLPPPPPPASSLPAWKRQRMHRLRKRMLDKARNRLADAHRHTARWLCERFDVVLLPKFKTSSMLPGLANRAARMLASWAHYRFRSAS